MDAAFRESDPGRPDSSSAAQDFDTVQNLVIHRFALLHLVELVFAVALPVCGFQGFCGTDKAGQGSTVVSTSEETNRSPLRTKFVVFSGTLLVCHVVVVAVETVLLVYAHLGLFFSHVGVFMTFLLMAAYAIDFAVLLCGVVPLAWCSGALQHHVTLIRDSSLTGVCACVTFVLFCAFLFLTVMCDVYDCRFAPHPFAAVCWNRMALCVTALMCCALVGVRRTRTGFREMTRRSERVFRVC